MENGSVAIFYGEGQGKSSAAIGEAAKAVAQGKEVFVIQFLKGKQSIWASFAEKLEPAIKWFSFEKQEEEFEELSEEKKRDAIANIQTGLHFAHKVLASNETDVVILDEILGLVDLGIIEAKDIINMMQDRWGTTDLVLTGRTASEELLAYADYVSKIEKIK